MSKNFESKNVESMKIEARANDLYNKHHKLFHFLCTVR